jgi:hypothetical protein
MIRTNLLKSDEVIADLQQLAAQLRDMRIRLERLAPPKKIVKFPKANARQGVRPSS